MSHPKDDQLIPVGSKVAIIRGTNFGRTAVITGYNFQFNGSGFLNYYGTIDGREGEFALFHDDIEVISYTSPA